MLLLNYSYSINKTGFVLAVLVPDLISSINRNISLCYCITLKPINHIFITIIHFSPIYLSLTSHSNPVSSAVFTKVSCECVGIGI